MQSLLFQILWPFVAVHASFIHLVTSNRPLQAEQPRVSPAYIRLQAKYSIYILFFFGNSILRLPSVVEWPLKVINRRNNIHVLNKDEFQYTLKEKKIN